MCDSGIKDIFVNASMQDNCCRINEGKDWKQLLGYRLICMDVFPVYYDNMCVQCVRKVTDIQKFLCASKASDTMHKLLRFYW